MNTNQDIIQIRVDDEPCNREVYGVYSELYTRSLSSIFGDNQLKAYAVFSVYDNGDFESAKIRALQEIDCDAGDEARLSIDGNDVVARLGNGKLVEFWSSEWGGIESAGTIENGVLS